MKFEVTCIINPYFSVVEHIDVTCPSEQLAVEEHLRRHVDKINETNFYNFRNDEGTEAWIPLSSIGSILARPIEDN